MSRPGPGTTHTVRYGDSAIPFVVRRQPGRHVGKVAIHVEPDGQVVIDAAPDDLLERIRWAVTKRAPWIERHVREAHLRRAHVLPREYVSGEAAHYLGRRYRLKVSLGTDVTPVVRLRGGYIEVTCSDTGKVEPMLQDWYRARARDYFPERIAAVASELPWMRQLPRTRLAFLKRQWGNCSPAGILTLNIHLMQAPRECMDYVLLHELCHLREHNHSRRFYRLLDRYMPGWRDVKTRLDNMADTLMRPSAHSAGTSEVTAKRST